MDRLERPGDRCSVRRMPAVHPDRHRAPAAIAADLWIIATVIAVIRRRTAATATAKTKEPAALAIP
jgi:hypothetical protein